MKSRNRTANHTDTIEIEMVDLASTSFDDSRSDDECSAESKKTYNEKPAQPKVSEPSADERKQHEYEDKISRLLQQYYPHNRVKFAWEYHLQKVNSGEILPSQGGFFSYNDYQASLNKHTDLKATVDEYLAHVKK